MRFYFFNVLISVMLVYYILYVCFSQFSNCLRNLTMKTIDDFGYGFNEVGQLRKLHPTTGLLTEDGFDFNISSDHSVNQKNYEELGEAITQYVYDLQRNEGHLKEYPVPPDGQLQSFIFGTKDIFTNADKLMVLIHGSGVVRAGQWARSLIINDSLNSGTQIPYIERAKQLGYAVLVTNTNDNDRFVDNVKKKIPHSSSPEEHAQSVWTNYVRKSPAKFIAIVAHSYGGIVCTNLATQNYDDFKSRVRAIAMTDSVHRARGSKSFMDKDYFSNVAVNWVSSYDALDTKQSPPKDGSDCIPSVSAGTSRHEMTSFSCIESVFKFIEAKYASHKKVKL